VIRIVFGLSRPLTEPTELIKPASQSARRLYHPESADQGLRRSGLEKALSFEGYFWLPGREVDRQSGIMRVGPGVAPTIATTQPLISPWREVGRTDHGDGQATVTRAFAEEKLTTPVTIYGLDDGKRPLTLISAMTTHWAHPTPRVTRTSCAVSRPSLAATCVTVITHLLASGSASAI
jgi:hypothetical protein